MIEETAGTRMYEQKRQMAQKTIEKKDAKYRELHTVSSHSLNVHTIHAKRFLTDIYRRNQSEITKTTRRTRIVHRIPDNRTRSGAHDRFISSMAILRYAKGYSEC